MRHFGSRTISSYGIYFATLCVALLFSNWGFKHLLQGASNCCTTYGALQHDFYFQPYISIVTSRIIENLFGLTGLVLIGQVILPALVFYLLVMIFNRYLSKIWAIAIGVVSVFSFTDYPFRNFLITLIDPSSPLSGSALLPELANFPIPSLSVLCFLLTFYHSTKLTKLDSQRISLLTVLWSVQVYINAIDALFGVCFWFSYFSIKLFRRVESGELLTLVKPIATQLLILLVIFLPALLLADFSVGAISIASNFNILVYYALYMLLPVALMVILFRVHKIDYYEILYKFWTVYTLMFLEIFLVSAAFFFGKGVSLEILTGRIAMFFLHFYYYLPVIFYASRQYYSFHVGADGDKTKNQVRWLVFIAFNRLNYIYLPIVILLVASFAYISSNHFIN